MKHITAYNMSLYTFCNINSYTELPANMLILPAIKASTINT